MESQEFYLVKEVADRFRRHSRTILRWIEIGDPFIAADVVRVKDGYLIRKTAVERIIKAGEENNADK